MPPHFAGVAKKPRRRILITGGGAVRATRTRPWRSVRPPAYAGALPRRAGLGDPSIGRSTASGADVRPPRGATVHDCSAAPDQGGPTRPAAPSAIDQHLDFRSGADCRLRWAHLRRGEGDSPPDGFVEHHAESELIQRLPRHGTGVSRASHLRPGKPEAAKLQVKGVGARLADFGSTPATRLRLPPAPRHHQDRLHLLRRRSRARPRRQPGRPLRCSAVDLRALASRAAQGGKSGRLTSAR